MYFAIDHTQRTHSLMGAVSAAAAAAAGADGDDGDDAGVKHYCYLYSRPM